MLRPRFNSAWLFPAALLLIASILPLLSCSNYSTAAARNHQPEANNNYYELKFQIELDNSTISKLEHQQQIFKCQVRLAPVGNWAKAAGRRLAKLFSNNKLELQQQQQLRNSSSHKQLIKNVILSIDWFKNGQNLTDLGSLTDEQGKSEQIAVISVDLRQANNNSGLNNGGNNDKRSQQGKSKRIEVKNTLNEAQLKLTSRLRINQLKKSDSGQYKCIARAHFATQPVASLPAELASESPNGNHNDADLSATGAGSGSSESPTTVVQSQQMLESNEASLSVTNIEAFKIDNEPSAVKQQESPAGSRLLPETSPKQASSQDYFWPSKWLRSRLNLYGDAAQAQPANQMDAIGGGAGGRRYIINHISPRFNDTRHATSDGASEVSSRRQTNEAPIANDNARGPQTWADNNEATLANLAGLNPDGIKPALGAARGKMSPGDNNQREAGASGGNWRQAEGLGADGAGAASDIPETPFQDDEDLFKVEQLRNSAGIGRARFINGPEQRVPSLSSAVAITEPANDDDEEDPRGRDSGPVDFGEIVGSRDEHQWAQFTEQQQQQQPNSVEWPTNDLDNKNESSRSPTGRAHLRKAEGPASGADSAGRHSLFADSNQDQQQQPAGTRKGFVNLLSDFGKKYSETTANNQQQPPPRHADFGCYTNFGESYRGNHSSSHDNRVCLDWEQIISELRATLNGQSRHQLGNGNVFSLLASAGRRLRKSDRNYCRNPNVDTRGPWCFVAHNGQLDAGPGSENLISIFLPGSLLQPNGLPETTSDNPRGPLLARRYIQRHCAIAPCSEYLWLYIVAPPLGLLLVLSCLSILVVRHIRKRNQLIDWESPSSLKKNNPLNRLFVFSKGSGKFGAEKFTTTINRKGAYLEKDELFEIVDDIDWSDGCNQQYHNPDPFNAMQDSHCNSTGLINELPGNVYGRQINSFNSSNDNRADLLNCAGHKSVTQVGPMFATLRCHIRRGGGAQSEQMGSRNKIGCKNLTRKSPSTLIELSNSSLKKSCSCVRSFTRPA